MVTVEVDEGLDEFIKKLEKVSVSAVPLMKVALYDGASEVANEVRKNIQALPASPKNYIEKGKGYVCNQLEKKAMLDGLGIAKFKSDYESADTSIGMDGYFETARGESKPIAMIARSIESGTSWIHKRPFVRPAVNAAKDRAISKMQATFAKEFSKRFK